MITYREAIREALTQAMEYDPAVFVYGLDVPDHKRIFGTTVGLVETFGSRRCFGTPLSEDALVGFGIGAALNGLRPVNVHIRVDFVLLAMNQIVNMLSNIHYASAGKLHVPIVIRAVIGRGWGQGMQHSKTVQSFFAHVPGLKVVMPTTPADAKGLTLAAIQDNNPVLILEHRWLYDSEGHVPLHPEEALVPIGVPHLLREGNDITIIATSWMNIEALHAASIMERKQGVQVEVIDARTIAPLDYTLLFASARKTRHVIVADLDWLPCGFSAEVAAQIAEHCFSVLQSPIARVGFASTPCPTTRPLESAFYPNAMTLIRLIEKKLRLSATDLSGEVFYSYEHAFKGPF